MAVVIDDRLLLDCLADRIPQPVANELERGEVFTTGAWYYRLGRAAFGGSGAGTLSGRLAYLEATTRQQVGAALQELPDNIGLLHPRVVVPVMFTLRVRRQLNVLTAEALAVAVLLQARIAVTTEAPLLHAGATDLGLDYQVLP